MKSLIFIVDNIKILKSESFIMKKTQNSRDSTIDPHPWANRINTEFEF